MTGEDVEITRIGISLPEKLLEEFDEILKCRHYLSRSEGIRDAIRTYNLIHQWLSDSEHPRQGAITLVYNFTDVALLESITTVRSQHRSLITTSVQTYVDREKRVEVLLVHGSGADIKRLVDLFSELKGIRIVKVSTTRSGPPPAACSVPDNAYQNQDLVKTFDDS